MRAVRHGGESGTMESIGGGCVEGFRAVRAESRGCHHGDRRPRLCRGRWGR